MKAAVSLYSFHKYAADRTLGVKDCIQKAYELGAMGLDFVEVGLSYGDYLTYAADIRRHCRDVGIAPICFCTGADFLRCEDQRAEIEKVKRNVEIAAAYGCTVLRHDISRGFPAGDERTYDDAIEIVAPAVREITRYAEQWGIITATENHGFFSQDSKRVETLIRAVNEKNFGALVDIGNFLCADEDPVSAVARLAPYAVHAHAKDFYIRSARQTPSGEGWFKSRAGDHLLGAILGKGDVAVDACIDALRAGGYEGYLSLEFEGAEDPMTGVTLGMEYLKRFTEK
ncbi:MAG: sugar phosphate isomerase/epimerase [Clostridia bacterium]|nr:sugar phosphate isomerase/epimerase [Clostridia bacterium]